MINTKKAFTLVELIVVITILAILGTIAFISLQGYSADARNSKRTQDLNNLAGSVNIKVTKGTPIMSFVADNSSYLTAGTIAGIAMTTTDYNAGTVNYTALGVKTEDFKDPDGSSYKMGVTTNKDGQFEFAAKVENGAGNATAKITGNYIARGIATTDTATITSGTGTINIKINSSDINKILRGDTVTAAGTAGLTVVKVSSDGGTLTLSAPAGTTGTNLVLDNAEVGGLIGTSLALGTPVTEGSENVPY